MDEVPLYLALQRLGERMRMLSFIYKTFRSSEHDYILSTEYTASLHYTTLTRTKC